MNTHIYIAFSVMLLLASQSTYAQSPGACGVHSTCILYANGLDRVVYDKTGYLKMIR